MTEVEIKELARKYINSCTKRAGFVILTEGIMNDFIDLFVAGFMKCLELNEIKWHKVADGDLPEDSRLVLIQMVNGNTTMGIYYVNAWREICNCKELTGVIAWCEIPKYTEE